MPDPELPSQTEVMHRMLAANPYGSPGDPPIGPPEGRFFSDIRLHIALVLRAKNPHAFRGDAFPEECAPSAEQVERISSCSSLAKLRFVSEDPLPDKRHITFMTHAADAMAELGNSTLIYDRTAERLIDRSELSSALGTDPKGTAAETHVRILWKPMALGGRSETRGMQKIGRPDLVSAEMDSDEQVLVSAVLTEAAKQLWDGGTISEPFEVQAFEDVFQVQALRPKDGRIPVRIMRVRMA
jgi:hypothetical protein